MTTLGKQEVTKSIVLRPICKIKVMMSKIIIIMQTHYVNHETLAALNSCGFSFKLMLGILLWLYLCQFVILSGYTYISWKCVHAKAVPFIEMSFPIFARASSAFAVALRLRLDHSSRYRSSISATNIAHINKYKLEIDVNQASDHGNKNEYNHSTGYDERWTW